jgi:hypothetical protein
MFSIISLSHDVVVLAHAQLGAGATKLLCQEPHTDVTSPL